MMAVPFSAVQDDFLRFTHEIVWCTVTTVDGRGRPRSRILHPYWEVVAGRPVGWIFTGRTPVKARHLAENPHVAFSYWSPAQHVVLGEATASWVEDLDAKQRVWDMFMNAPPPMGYDIRTFGVPGPESEAFTVLRLDPSRVQVLDGTTITETLTPRLAVIDL
ncbi:pyridoxamine 5'-phosphate oxidase family protein [Spirillospora sp. CA-253888]